MYFYWFKLLDLEARLVAVTLAHLVALTLAHLVARMGWAHTISSKETDPYPPNYTPSISPICRMGLGYA